MIKVDSMYIPRVTQVLHLQFARFVLVGFINTSISYSAYAIFLLMGLHYAVANLTALLLSILLGFYLQGRYVFCNTNRRLVARFIVGWAGIYLATLSIISGLITLGFDAYVSGAAALPVSALMSYLVQTYFVFRRLQTGKPGACR